jgi:hypothetical protein
MVARRFTRFDEPRRSGGRCARGCGSRGTAKAVERVMEVANQQVAHRTRVDVRSLTVPEVDAAFDAIEEALQKYNLLLEGSSLVGAEPSPQFDTLEVFTFPWLRGKSNDD